MSAEKHLSEEELTQYRRRLFGVLGYRDTKKLKDILKELDPLHEEDKRIILDISAESMTYTILFACIVHEYHKKYTAGIGMLEALLEAGIDPNLGTHRFRKKHGAIAPREILETPIGCAIRFCHNSEEAILLLIKAGANLDTEGPEGETLEEYIEATFKNKPDVATRIVEAIYNKKFAHIKGESSERINHHSQPSSSAVERLAEERSLQGQNFSPSM